MKTLIIVSHPYQERSTIIKALQQAAEAQDNVEVRNLEALYGDNVSGFDIAREQASLSWCRQDCFYLSHPLVQPYSDVESLS